MVMDSTWLLSQKAVRNSLLRKEKNYWWQVFPQTEKDCCWRVHQMEKDCCWRVHQTEKDYCLPAHQMVIAAQRVDSKKKGTDWKTKIQTAGER